MNDFIPTADFVNELIDLSLRLHKKLLIEVAECLLTVGADKHIPKWLTCLTRETSEWVYSLSASDLTQLIIWLANKIDIDASWENL